MTNPCDAPKPQRDSAGGRVPVPAGTSPQFPRWAVIGIFLLLLTAGLAVARNFLAPVALSFLLALVFTPIRRFLERLGLAPRWSALLIVSALVVVLVAVTTLLWGPVQEWIDDAPRIGREVEGKLRDLLGSAHAVVEATEQVNKIAKTGSGQSAPEVVVRPPGVLANLATAMPEILGESVLSLVLLLFLLSSGDMFYEKIVHVMPTLTDKRRAMQIVSDIEQKLSHYLFAITVINAGLGTAIGVSMWLLGMPNPLLFGVIGFAVNFVPYLGAACGIMLVTIAAVMTFDGLGHALFPGAVYLGLATFEGQIVTPYFVGRNLKMNTVAVFLAIALGAWLWSVIGMLLAVPLLVAVRAFCEHIPKLRPVGDFLSTRGQESDNQQSVAVPS